MKIYRIAYLSIITTFLLLAASLPVRAQSMSQYTFTPSSGFYFLLNDATVQRTINDNLDDGIYPLAPIGFNFKFNDVVYTTVSASTDGWMSFGRLAGDGNLENSLNSGLSRPIAAPLWDDLAVNPSNGSVSYITLGTAPNRQFRMQWKNMQWKASHIGSTGAISFQVILYETTNVVQFVYRPEIGALYCPNGENCSASIGLAATQPGSFLSLSDSGTNPTVSTTTETTTIGTKPAYGQTYTFTPSAPTPTPNTPPNAVNDVSSVNEDTTLNINAPGVLGNDTDVENNPLTASLVSSTTNGTLNFNANGSFSYTPNQNFNGTDSFTYKASDGNSSSSAATVTITVTEVNDSPTAANDSKTTDEDTALVFSGSDLTANDSAGPANESAQTLTLTMVISTANTNGIVSLNNGQISYQPAANYNGAASFDYKVCDNGTTSGQSDPKCSIATVNVTVTAVNDVPAANGGSLSTNEDTSSASFMLNGSDADNDSLTFEIVTAPVKGTYNQTTGIYTPNANANGSDSFTFIAKDAVSQSPAATVSITINPVNDAPTAAGQSVSTDEDANKTITLSGSDVDGDALTYNASQPSHGSVSCTGASCIYTPTANYNGSDSFTFRTNDGQTDSQSATVSITVNPVSDPPTATAQSVTTDEDLAKAITLSGSDPDGANTTLTYTIVAQPLHGTLSGTGANRTYTPAANYYGADSFTFRVNDGEVDSAAATVSITVNAVNDAPTAAGNTYNTNEDTALNVAAAGVLANDSDIENDSLTAILVSGPASGSLTLNANGSFAYTPSANFYGSDSFTYKANDGSLNSNTVTVTITVVPLNDAPVVSNDKAMQNAQYSDAIQTVTVNASDVDSPQPLSASVSFTKDGGASQSGLPAGMSLSSADCTASGVGTNCAWTVTGKALVAPGTYAVTVKVQDSSGAYGTTGFNIVVTKEDARVYYTGMTFVNTASATSGTAATTLSATIRDISAETTDPMYDAFSGDIRNATVTFVNRDVSPNVPIAGCIDMPVQLVNVSDPKTGTATCNWSASIGNAESDSFTIGIVVNNYYAGNASTDVTVVTVSKPLGTNFITGGGYLVLTGSSAGQYAGGAGLKTNFGFNVKYNNSGTNLKGKVNIIVRAANGKVYQIKTNAIETLATNNANPLARTATFTSKANLTDITDPLNPISLGGGHSFQMKLTDRGEPGSTDTIGITLYANGTGALLFSSNWSGTQTIEQILAGGNLQVR
ncbi:MAG: T1SS secreted agglutinin RTX [uncultured Pyrinomonadaceae bacterium]|uniref:T1SS secreted agglutinin RTX n=1 Tax=uncultured Pyrinomonadaceae bacterium TaxID=2283094 RepID=A0A6J4N6P4_9BACT|nr:MAG: T1SS secreted agglutinin RTX [uncultured Pyrinomonadaceae bacterium]